MEFRLTGSPQGAVLRPGVLIGLALLSHPEIKRSVLGGTYRTGRWWVECQVPVLGTERLCGRGYWAKDRQLWRKSSRIYSCGCTLSPRADVRTQAVAPGEKVGRFDVVRYVPREGYLVWCECGIQETVGKGKRNKTEELRRQGGKACQHR